jgi:o-succinylbenzoate---CoA ligase
MVVPAWLPRAAAAHPDRTALETPEGSLSYAELERRAERAAAGLRAGGVEAGDRVALALKADEAFVVALHACLRLGAVAMPVDLRSAERERTAIMQEAVVVVEGPLSEGASTGALDEGGGSLAPALLHDLDAPALIVHTSGTSGTPKPVALTYGNLLWSAMGSAIALGLDPEERWLCPLPLSHVGGLSVLMRSAIQGTTAVLLPGFEPHAVARSLAEQRVTAVSLVATMVRRLLDAGRRPAPSLRFALVGGAGLDPSLAARARGVGLPVVTTYGLTEACSQVATDGVPLFCTRVRIDEGGEILVAGPTVAPGAIGADGFLRTGDLGALDERGRLVVIGRRAETIVTGGDNVAPAEVEAALLEHPAVAEAAVHGRADPEWGEAVTATVVLHEGASVSAEELRSYAGARLARFKVPKAVEFARALPRTASGKLRRAELR